MNRAEHQGRRRMWVVVALAVGVVAVFAPRWALPSLIAVEALMIGRAEWHRGWLARDDDYCREAHPGFPGFRGIRRGAQ